MKRLLAVTTAAALLAYGTSCLSAELLTWKRCTGNAISDEDRIAACTAVIASTRTKRASLAKAYSNRCEARGSKYTRLAAASSATSAARAYWLRQFKIAARRSSSRQTKTRPISSARYITRSKRTTRAPSRTTIERSNCGRVPARHSRSEAQPIWNWAPMTTLSRTARRPSSEATRWPALRRTASTKPDRKAAIGRRTKAGRSARTV